MSFDSADHTKEVVTAIEKKWHPEHFSCTHCQKPIDDVAFKVHEDKPYCNKDYVTLFAPKCKACNQSIDGSIVKALDASWHSKCFQCQKCKKPITGSSFKDVNGMPHCLTC